MMKTSIATLLTVFLPLLVEGAEQLRRSSAQDAQELRERLSPSVWAMPMFAADDAALDKLSWTQEEQDETTKMCANILHKSIKSSVEKKDDLSAFLDETEAESESWSSDAVIETGTYFGRMKGEPMLRTIVEGTIRRRASQIVEDPYQDIYENVPLNEKKQKFVIEKEATKEEEMAAQAQKTYHVYSGARYLTELYDYYIVSALNGMYKPKGFMQDPDILKAALLVVETMTKEQKHYYTDIASMQGKGDIEAKMDEKTSSIMSVTATASVTGMTWSESRPYSNGKSKLSYSIPSNIFAASALERIIELNKRIWDSEELEEKATILKALIEDGINKYGIISAKNGEKVYAHEVDGKEGVLLSFKEADLPELLSIPLMGWTGLNEDVYRATIAYHGLPSSSGKYSDFAKSLAQTIEAIVNKSLTKENAQNAAFQLHKHLVSVVESLEDDDRQTKRWYEWSNALFVTMVEAGLAIKCDSAEMLPLVDNDDDDKKAEEEGDNPFHLRTANVYKSPFAKKFNLGPQSFYQDLMSWDTLFRTV